MHDIIEQFRSAMLAAGITPPTDIIADGNKHRFSTNGKSSDKAGEYRIYMDSIPAGYFLDYRTDIYHPWRYDLKRPYTTAERTQFNEAAKKHEMEVEAERAKAALEAQNIWSSASAAPSNHPYLVKKQIKPIGIKASNNCLLIPVASNKKIMALQHIYPNGDKLFLPEGCTTKGGYFALGKPGGTVLFVEGYASGVIAHEATGYAVVITFSCYNLPLVAKCMREKFPNAIFAYCADDDFKLQKNNGLIEAQKAVNLAGGIIIKPKFNDPRPDKATDINDMAVLYGIDAVKTLINNAVNLNSTSIQGGVILTRASSIEPEPINWLWKGYLAASKFHILAGKPGTGKTTIALDFASIMSTGRNWPDGTKCDAANVVMWSGEDDINDTLVPRVIGQRGDRNRIEFISGTSTDTGDKRPFNPAIDIPKLRLTLQSRDDIKLIIIDPIATAITGDSHNNSDVRKSLQPLVDLANELNIAIVGITHFSKNSSDKDVLDQVTGSLAFGAVARIVLATSKVKIPGSSKTRCVLLRIKSNLGKFGDGFYYEVDEKELANYPGIDCPTIKWGDKTEDDINELLHQHEGKQSKLEQAKDFLTGLLGNGAMLEEEIKRIYIAAAFARATINRAKADLDIKSFKNEFTGPWWWCLPPKNSEDIEVTPHVNLITFDQFEHLRKRLLEIHPMAIEGIPLEDILLCVPREDYADLMDIEALTSFTLGLIKNGTLPRKVAG